VNVFKKLATAYKRKSVSLKGIKIPDSGFNLTDGDFNDSFLSEPQVGNAYLFNAWVNIAVNILVRNIARADFCIKKGGGDVTSGTSQVINATLISGSHVPLPARGICFSDILPLPYTVVLRYFGIHTT
jgi:hypothetical protein